MKVSMAKMENNLKIAQEHLCAGNLVAIPTETVYGLAADAHHGQAVAQIFAAKGRPQFNPLICHVSNIEMAKRYGDFDILSERLAETFWPAPLTLVLPKTKTCPAHDLVTANLNTIGLRAPQGIAHDLIKAYDRALAAPSANTSGKISPTSAQHVKDDLGDKVDYILDGGTCDVGLESTILKIEGQSIRILRAGAITAEMIASALGLPVSEIEHPQEATTTSIEAPKIEAPGMMLSHYAPNAKVRLNATTIESGEAALLFGSDKPEGLEMNTHYLNLSIASDLIEAASNLYAHMKALDAKGIDRIAVQPIPNHGIGLAINDRLNRAAAPRAEVQS
jgi:L-threonylcarbamoyladenylate synthase